MAFEQWWCLLAQSILLTGFLARKDVLKLVGSFRESSVRLGRREGGSEYQSLFGYVLWLWGHFSDRSRQVLLAGKLNKNNMF